VLLRREASRAIEAKVLAKVAKIDCFFGCVLHTN